jgi:hypothetical protein
MFGPSVAFGLPIVSQVEIRAICPFGHKGATMDAKQLREMKLEDVLNWTGRNDPTSPNHDRGMAELRFREIILQLKSSEAQIAAADAQKLAADAAVKGTAATERNAKYMLNSVIVAAIAAIFAATSAIATAYSVWPKK